MAFPGGSLGTSQRVNESPRPQLCLDAPNGVFDIAGGLPNLDGGTIRNPTVHFLFGGDDGAVAATAKVRADLGKGGPSVLPRQPHGEHSGMAG